MKQKEYKYCCNWKYHVANQCKRINVNPQLLEKRSYVRATTTSKVRDKRSLSSRCYGYGAFHINRRNDLEVSCDFSRCYGGKLVSYIRWERDTNLRYSPYDYSDYNIYRIGIYKSLLRIRNYKPWKDDGTYRCEAKMLYSNKHPDCYDGRYRFKRHSPCRGSQFIQSIHANINVFGRSFRENTNFLYDNIGYAFHSRRNRHRNTNNNYRHYRNDGRLSQIRFR